MKILTETAEKCEEFAKNTIPELKGWWYHSCTEKEGKELIAGQVNWINDKEMCFTRAEIGAKHKIEHTHVIRAIANPTDRDQYSLLDPKESELQDGYYWLKVKKPVCIRIDSGYMERIAKKDGA